jgi:hypothetical protein
VSQQYKLIGFPDERVERAFGQFRDTVVTFERERDSGRVLVKLSNGRLLSVDPENLEPL